MASKTIKICEWNAQGLSDLATIKQLELFITQEDIDILFVVETFFKPNHKFHLNNYVVHRNDRLNNHGGGVAIVIKNTIPHIVLQPFSTISIENIAVTINLNGQNVNMICAYCPKFTADFKQDIIKFCQSRNHFLIFGDFNARNTAWCCANDNQAGKILFDLQLRSNFFIHHSNSPTHYPHSGRTPSCLDILLSNSTFHISDLSTINDQLNSDHTPVICTINADINRTTIKTDDFKNADWNLFRKIINNSINLNSDFNSCNISSVHINQLITNLTNIIINAKNCAIPTTNKYNFHFQLSETTKLCITNRNSLKRKWQRCTNQQEKILLKSLLNLNNQIIKKNVHLDRNTNWNKTLSNLKTGSKNFWQIKKRLSNGSNRNIFKIINHNGDPVFSNEDKANCIADSFMTAHDLTRGNNFKHPVEGQVSKFIDRLNINSHLDTISSIKPSEIYHIIKKFRNFKAPGFDGIQNILLKNLPRKAIILLTQIFNGCLNFGYFPSNFKCAKIVPVLKPNKNPANPSSYRPISLLSCIGKIFEKIILNRMNIFIDENNTIINEQFGFRREHSTIHQISRVTNYIKSNKVQRKSTGLVLLDIEKAFDTVWHNGLLFKLQKFGFPLSIIKIIQSFLSNRHFNVYINGSISRSVDIPAGVPQGSILSPTLFSLYTSDFKKLKCSEIAFYADDTAIYAASKQIRGVITKLQRSLNSCNNYFRKWKIKINPDKTQAIYFSFNNSRRNIPQKRLILNNSEIQFSENIKYLGIHLDKKLNFGIHIQKTCEKAITCSRILYPFLAPNSKLSFDNKMLIYNQVIRSIITYGSPIWFNAANTHLKKLQIIQNKNLKIINKLPRGYSTLLLHQELNMLTIANFINQFCNSFFDKCNYSNFQLIREIVSE